MDRFLKLNNIHSRADRVKLNQLLIKEFDYPKNGSKKYSDNLQYLSKMFNAVTPSGQEYSIRKIFKILYEGRTCCGICGDVDDLAKVWNELGESMLMCKDCIRIQKSM